MELIGLLTALVNLTAAIILLVQTRKAKSRKRKG